MFWHTLNILLKLKKKKYLYRVGQGKGDSEGQAFRHSYDQHRHTDDDELDVEIDEIHTPGRILKEHNVSEMERNEQEIGEKIDKIFNSFGTW